MFTDFVLVHLRSLLLNYYIRHINIIQLHAPCLSIHNETKITYMSNF